jgi:diguanylate cyclase (GGDEF)-like protein/putative nucleotidyltransferase with HDIG domain
MHRLTLPARVYVVIVVTAGAILTVARLPALHFDRPLLFVALLALSFLTSAMKVRLPIGQSGSTMSVSYAIDFASLILVGPDLTMIVAAASAWSQCTFRVSEPTPLHRTVFSMACLAITVQVAGRVMIAMGSGPSLGDVARPLVAAAATYYVCNTGMVSLAIALATRWRFFGIWSENFLWTAPSYFVGAGAGWLIASLVGKSTSWLLPLVAAPLYLTYRSYRMYLARLEDHERHVHEMSDLHLATIEALALAIDAKDQCQSHIRHVQVYAAEMARAMGMSDKEIQGVKTAALLHDIGKLAVPEHILSKPGPLTAEEQQKVTIHPTIGAEIIRAVPFPYPVAPLIESHHERWDGTGYPHGLKAEEIPLGARILSVVDYYDAITTDRPYRKAMTEDVALNLMRDEAGKALDPVIVAKFIDLLPSLRSAAQREQATRRLQVSPTDAARVTMSRREGANTSVFDDIALAHREIYALYEIAQTMGTGLGVADTMTLIASKVTKVVPSSCSALYVFDEDRDIMTCCFAAGVDGDLVRRVSLKTGAGLAGWVARNRVPVVNGRPSADLEAAGIAEPTTLQSSLVCPLMFNDRFIGALALYHEDPAAYREDDRRLLERVCEQAAGVINNAMAFEQAQTDALTDPLTGLPNSRFLVTHLTREIARAERLKAELAVLVVDLDGFKAINDRFGHQVGDRALRKVGRVLEGSVRPYDFCARYAGDEFVVVLPGCGRDEALRKAADLQRTLDETMFEAEPGSMVPLAASVGAATFPEHGMTYEGLLARADKQMYLNKTERHGGVVTPEPRRAEPRVEEKGSWLEGVDRRRYTVN